MRFKAFNLLLVLFFATTVFGCDSQDTTGNGSEGPGGDQSLFEVIVVDSQDNLVSGLSVFVCYGSCANAGNAQQPPVEKLSPILSGELDYFYSEVNGQDVTLFWGTLSEVNNAGFEVQMLDSGSWNALGFVEGNGTTTEAQTYSFHAGELAVGTHMFRLKQIDFDGAFEYHGVVLAIVTLAKPVQVVAAYPNPFHFQIQLSFAVDHNQSVGVTVHDLEGTLIQTLFNGPVEGNQLHLVTWDPGNGPPIQPGVYHIKVSAESVSDSISVGYSAESTQQQGYNYFQLELGITNPSGVLRVDDRTRFPSLYGVESMITTDEASNRISSIEFANDVTIILKDDSGLVRRYQRFINSDHNSFELVWQ